MKNALIKLHIAVFLWGFTGVLGRLISFNEGLLVWYRIFFTVVSLFVLMWWRGQLERVNAKSKWQLFATGGIIALHWCFFYGSIKYANVSIALTCFSAGGFFTALLEPLIFHPFTVWAAIKGNIDLLRKKKSWGEMSRKGFNAKVTP